MKSPTKMKSKKTLDVIESDNDYEDKVDFSKAKKSKNGGDKN